MHSCCVLCGMLRASVSTSVMGRGSVCVHVCLTVRRILTRRGGRDRLGDRIEVGVLPYDKLFRLQESG